ncbi:MAG: hypothetical protein ACUVRU_12185, partial [Anaerolineae bacterium]
ILPSRTSLIDVRILPKTQAGDSRKETPDTKERTQSPKTDDGQKAKPSERYLQALQKRYAKANKKEKSGDASWMSSCRRADTILSMPALF